MSRMTLSRAKSLMNAAFKTAKKDILAGVASPETISRDLINTYWGYWRRLTKRDQPVFREWFDKRHEALGAAVVRRWRSA